MDELESIFTIHDEDRRLELVYQAAFLNRLPIALWRRPNQTTKHAIVDFSGAGKPVNLDLGGSPPGFVFSPFSNGKRKCGLVCADFHLAGHSVSYGEEGNGRPEPNIDKKSQFKAKLADLCQSNTNGRGDNQTGWYSRTSSRPIPVTTKHEFCSWVKAALSQIENSKLKKVVFSRSFEVALKNDFSAIGLFQQLCAAYPNAFVSLVAMPTIGTWIGATPELLLSLNDRELTTVALAGTQAVPSEQRESAVVWGKKEIVEQEIVSEYIRDCFEKHRILDFFEQGPETVRIGNILHLQTRFVWRHSLKNRMALVNHLLESLHPTPAVCGVPKANALSFIEEVETHRREFYAGFLGPVNIDNESHLFANLRCLQLQRESAILYAGGGITVDSVPEQEWLETRLKLGALLRIINAAHEPAFSEISDSTQRLEGAPG